MSDPGIKYEPSLSSDKHPNHLKLMLYDEAGNKVTDVSLLELTRLIVNKARQSMGQEPIDFRFEADD